MRYRLHVGSTAPLLAQMWTSFNWNKDGCEKWDEDWDGRSPKSLLRRRRNEKYWDQEEIYRKEMTKWSKAVRNVILIRHGQYEDLAQTEEEKHLTEIGVLPFTTLISSTLLRAMETAELISMELTDDDESKPLTRSSDVFLCEGAPCRPDPDVDFSYHKIRLLEDGTRIEAAFRRYFYRAPPEQRKDSYEVLACHAHVIRYFVCRALQFPPQGWTRLTIPHASITWIRILPNGRVILHWFANVGHLAPELVTLGLEHR